MRTLNAAFYSVILSFLIGGAVFLGIFSGSWINYPLHTFVESLGAFIALLIEVLILMLGIYERLPVRYIWIISALISMGVLDGFHAITQEIQSFVWLHSMAMLSGGLIFAFIWLPDEIARRVYRRGLPLMFLAAMSIIGVFTLISPSSVPLMIEAGEFTALARIMNLTGGILFLAAAGYFLLQHRSSNSRDNTIFSSHCLLFGLSGVLFEYSVPWDGVWWFWHLLRFAAYALVLYYFFLLSHAEERQLHLLNSELENRVALRTLQLSNELKERKLMEKKLKHLATHDPLTGLYNRNELERRIAEDLDRAARYQHPLSIFMVDIDHFKEINDNYGHAGGDRILRSIAFELERSLRKTDYVARFGGEEFLIVLPETSLIRALELGERLRQRIARHKAILGDDSVALTISIGVASFPDISTNWSDLLNAADTAMYQAKHDGRNCLRSARVTSSGS
jgi:diguanylate cyclase (GGDEF)-like protein